MDTETEVIIPTFVSPFLFWVIPKKDILLRSAIKRLLEDYPKAKLLSVEIGDMVKVQIDNIWVRGIVEQIIREDNGRKYLCWLCDYGIMKVVDTIYELERACVDYPHISKQASLYNLVNIKSEMTLDTGAEVKLIDRPTTEEVPGVTRVAKDFIELHDNLLFITKDEDEFNLYGDVIAITKEGKKSLSDHLIEKKLMVFNEEMFNSMDESRDHLMEIYFSPTLNVHKPLDTSESDKLSQNISHSDQNDLFPSEFFQRNKRPSHY